jgi:glycosyltransferase involved in cell wall biosynthesis
MKICFVTRFGKEAAGTLQAKFMADELKRRGIETEVIHFDDNSGILKNIISSFKKILRSDFDILHVMKCSPYSIAHSYVAAKIKGKPVIIHLDDYEFAIAKYHRHSFITPYIVKLFEVVFPRLCDVRIAISRFVYDMVKHLPRTYLIPYGIPEERFVGSKSVRGSIKLSGLDHVLIYVGSLTEGADLDLVLKSVKVLVGDNPLLGKRIRLVVVGGGRGEKLFIDMAKELGISKHVIFMGKQPFSVVPNFIKSADICLLPMKDTDMDKSRCPAKLSEYILSGRIVIGGSVGMVKEYLPKECLVPPDDPEAMADAVMNVLKSRKLQEKILEELKKVSGDLTIKNNVDMIVKIYNELLK